MAYEVLAELLETHKAAVAYAMAQQAKTKIKAYQNDSMTAEELGVRTIPTIELVINYLLKDDPAEYREHVRQVTLNRLAQGQSGQDLYDVAAVLTVAVKTMVEQQLSGPENERERLRYFRRLDGLQTLTQTTVLSTMASHKARQKQLQ